MTDTKHAQEIRGLKSLSSSSEQILVNIKNRKYGSDIIEDLNLKDFNQYFREIKSYFLKKASQSHYPQIIKKDIEEFCSLSLEDSFKRRGFNFFAFFNSDLTILPSSDPAVVTAIEKKISSIKALSDNLIYQFSIQ